jgi:endonuclease/exonuclease/phosphatase family metal-dependent hydrolase
VKVLTFNTWQERGPWQDRWEVAFGGIAELDPDVVALQEVFKRDWAQTVQRRLGFPELVYAEDAAGLVLLSKYPVRDMETKTYDTRSASESYRRYALRAELGMPAGPIAFFNTHLSWLPHDDAVREAQVRELTAWAGEKARGLPAVVCGDFNAAPETEPAGLMRRSGFIDAFGTLFPSDAGLTWSNRNPYTLEECNRVSGALLAERRIDYVFFKPVENGRGRVSEARVVLDRPDGRGIWPSDHFGMLAVIDF